MLYSVELAPASLTTTAFWSQDVTASTASSSTRSVSNTLLWPERRTMRVVFMGGRSAGAWRRCARMAVVTTGFCPGIQARPAQLVDQTERAKKCPI